jgi:hypothetical protein
MEILPVENIALSLLLHGAATMIREPIYSAWTIALLSVSEQGGECRLIGIANFSAE